MEPASDELIERMRAVKAIIFDVDGVLTDGGLIVGSQGEEYKRFHSRDGHGIKMLQSTGVAIAIITGRDSTIVAHRCAELGIDHVYQGCRDKRAAFDDLLQQTGLDATQVAYVGDDLPDLPLLRRAGLAVAVQNAHGFVKQHCDWVTTRSGGQGAVREVTDFILQSRSLLDKLQRSYLE